jgi:hypothetical protein
MPTERYQTINRYVMGVIYAPMLLLTSYIETSQAHRVNAARQRGDSDDDIVQECQLS